MNEKKQNLLKAMICLIFAYIICLPNVMCNAKVINYHNIDKEEMKNILSNIYNERCKALVNGELGDLSQYFDTSQKYGQWALEHEVKRVKYLNDWSQKRGIQFTNIESYVEIKKIYSIKTGVRMAAAETYKFEYIYVDDEENSITSNNFFGVQIDHTVDVVNRKDKWMIANDWYTDCFEDALKAYSGDIKQNKTIEEEVFKLGKCTRNPNTSYSGPYNRIRAVQYADKYCGVSWASGNNFKHNKKYKNYTGIGGDCTNYASQILGDKEAGGLKFDGTWYCTYHQYGTADGSRAWVNADGLRDYLIYSGKAGLVKAGKFKDLGVASPNYPCGIVQKLELGDLICYAKGNDMDHFAVVTGWDSHGYPLVNSHTTNRYHVPWDLGWGDEKIRFHLIHIR